MKNMPSNDPSLGAFFGRLDLCEEARQRLVTAVESHQLSSGGWRDLPDEKGCALEVMTAGFGGEATVHRILKDQYNIGFDFGAQVSQSYDERDSDEFVLDFANLLRPGLDTVAIANEVRMTNKPLLTVMAEHAAKVTTVADVLAAA